MFCPECGTDHHIGDRRVREELREQVEIERIHADRDIRVAAINAKAAVATAETENAIDAAAAEGRAEGMETAIAGGAVDGQADEPGADGAPIVVQAAAADEEPPAAPAADLAPPVVEVPSSPRERAGGGWWDGYH